MSLLSALNLQNTEFYQNYKHLGQIKNLVLTDYFKSDYDRLRNMVLEDQNKRVFLEELTFSKKESFIYKLLANSSIDQKLSVPLTKTFLSDVFENPFSTPYGTGTYLDRWGSVSFGTNFEGTVSDKQESLINSKFDDALCVGDWRLFLDGGLGVDTGIEKITYYPNFIPIANSFDESDLKNAVNNSTIIICGENQIFNQVFMEHLLNQFDLNVSHYYRKIPMIPVKNKTIFYDNENNVLKSLQYGYKRSIVIDKISFLNEFVEIFVNRGVRVSTTYCGRKETFIDSLKKHDTFKNNIGLFTFICVNIGNKGIEICDFEQFEN